MDTILDETAIENLRVDIENFKKCIVLQILVIKSLN